MSKEFYIASTMCIQRFDKKRSIGKVSQKEGDFNLIVISIAFYCILNQIQTHTKLTFCKSLKGVAKKKALFYYLKRIS